MTRCYILVEGQTEEAFVNRVLEPHLTAAGFHLARPVVVATKRPADGGKYRGGVTNWGQVERELLNLCGDGGATVTSMIDLYALPIGTPGLAAAPAGPPIERVRHIEAAIETHLARSNLLAHIMLHEFETLLYAQPSLVAAHFGEPGIADAMQADVDACGEPEAVDEGADTAPSKRLAAHVPGYLKATDGPTITAEIGLQGLRGACPHFSDWVSALESRARVS